jgi:2-methylisocitrate lyase-like PEP mutase family enzyme
MAHTTTLQTLIQAPDLLVMPGIFDGFSARLVAQTGFAAGFISGAGLSETLLGWSDVGLLGFELNLAAVTRLVACCPVPVLADADTGYGNAVNVYHTTRAFEQAGVAGLMIEDQTWPKRCGHMQGKDVIPAEEMVEKVHAMGDARRDPAFVLMARTDAFATHGLEEVLRRLTLYAEAGADLLFADALVSEADIATVARHIPKPLCVNMGFGIRARATTPLIAPMQLQALGVAVVIYPRLLTACAVQGMQQGIAALREAMQCPTVLERPELAVSFEDLNALVGFAELQAWERRYTTPHPLATRQQVG